MNYFIRHIGGCDETGRDTLLGPFDSLPIATKDCTDYVHDLERDVYGFDIEDCSLEILAVSDIYPVDLSQKIVVEVVAPKIKKVPQGVSQ